MSARRQPALPFVAGVPSFWLLAATALVAAAPAAQAQTYTFKTIASFNASDGAHPEATMTLDASDNLFGTTSNGGDNNGGTVFEIPHGSASISLLASLGSASGYDPIASLTLDSSGNLFGTAVSGGASGDGTVFEVPHGSKMITVIASFSGANGKNPSGKVAVDAAGNLFGATQNGMNGYGGVYEIAHGTNAITVLSAFNGTDGAVPFGDVTLDASGDLFGTTESGGAFGDGTVFEIAQGSTAITTLASFDGVNGKYPYAGVTMDSNGNLFGTTSSGGSHSDGTVFELAKGTSTITALTSFDGSDGATPNAGVTLDASGDLFGTTQYSGANGNGTVFEIAAGTNSISTLCSFDGTDGASPSGGLVIDGTGNLYGTTYALGQYGYGTVFELSPGSAPTAAPEPGAGLLLASVFPIALGLRRRRRDS